MRFRDLFHKTGDNLYPDWNTILSIKEFRDLADCPQSTIWHKEGTVWPHTAAVTNEMVNYFHRAGLPMNDDYYIQMVSAALCHDLGKPSTTKWDEEIQEYKTKCHGLEGAKITRRIFFDEPDIQLRERVCCMVRNHMVLHHLLDDKKHVEKKLKRLSWNLVPVMDMLILKHCDSLGSKNDIEIPEYLELKRDLIMKEALKLNCYTNPFEFENDFERLKYFNGVENAEEVEDFNVIVMIGLPGAGKDTYIKDVLDKDMPVLSRDTIRTEIGLKGEKPQGNKSEEEKVTRIFNERMNELCKEHKSFVINNTSLLKRYRENFNKTIIANGGHPSYVYVEAPTLEETKKRRDGMIEPDVIDNMFKRFEFPEMSECSILVLSKQNDKTTN